METQSLKAAKKAPKRTALDTITNDLKKQRKTTKTEKGKAALASSPVTEFTGGLVCELRIPVLIGDVSDNQDLIFSSLKSITYGEGSGTTCSLTIRGRDAAGTRREARIETREWYQSTGLPFADVTLLLSHKLLSFVAVPARLGKSRDKLRSINLTEDGLRIVVGLSIAPFTQSPVDAHDAVFRLMRLLIRIPNPTGAKESQDYGLFAGSQFNASALYHAIKPRGDEPMLQGEIDGLACSLRPFQRRSVQWMLKREHCSTLASTSASMPSPRNTLFQSLPVIDIGSGKSSKIFVNQWTGDIMTNAPAPLPQIAGGCLCEEMGLGKTVEVIACILRHPCPAASTIPPLRARLAAITKRPRIACTPCGTMIRNPHDSAAESYDGTWVQCDGCAAWMHADCIQFKGDPERLLCGGCLRELAMQVVPGTSKATLIVCPDPILPQWTSEIKRHSAPGALKVIEFGGQKASLMTSLEDMPVTAADLAGADIVVTTYSVLRHDLDFEAGGTSLKRSARHARKYPALPTPLTRLTWWRVILDEAQMVERASRAAEMAASLSMVNRWCVTGTPIGRGLADVYGLVRFLQMEPWHDRPTWERVIQRPVEEGNRHAQDALLRLLQPSHGGIMWRTSKNSVAEELGIPKQETVVQRLQLTPVEWHAYRRCHKDTAEHAQSLLPAAVLDAMRQAGAVLAEDDRELTNREADALFPKLVRLRQTCCHPQVGQRNRQPGGGGSAAAAGAQPKTMSAVLRDLVDRDRGEAQEAQRVLVAAFNGLAGLALLQSRTDTAVAMYGRVLELVRVNAGVCDVDRLQHMHAVANLSAVAKSSPAKVVALGVRPQDIHAQALALQKDYIADSLANMAAATDEFKLLRKRLASAAAHLAEQDAASFMDGGEVDKANAWWWAVLSRVQKVCEPDTARVRVVRAEKTRLAVEEANRKAAEEVNRRAEEAAQAEPLCALEEEAAGPSGGTAAPSDTGPGGSSPLMKRTKKGGFGDKSSPGKGKGKGKGKGSPSKKQGKGGRIPDEWDSDDSEFEDLEEEVSEEEDELEPEEESLDEQYVRFFKQQLEVATDAYNTTSTANGLGIRDRFHTVAQLQELLRRHFQRLDSVQEAVLAEIERLEPICRKPPADLCERAGACEQCHGADGVPGVVCAHCNLETRAVQWEAALFRFSARSVKAGAMVSEDEALEVYRAELMSGGGQGVVAPAQRKKTAIASVSMTHLDNEHSLLLQALVFLLRRPATDAVHAVGTGPAERAAMLQLAQAQQSTLAASRALFLKARQAILRQRAHLYKYDELSMCTARLKLRGSDSYSPLREQLYLHKHEISTRVHTMTVEMTAAEVDYKAAIGQLRYAINLQRERKQDAPAGRSTAAEPAATVPAAAEPSSAAGSTPAAAPPPAADASGSFRQVAAAEKVKPDVQPKVAVPEAVAAAAPSDAAEQSSEEVIVLDSDEDCVIVEGLGIIRDSQPGPPRRVHPAAFTSSSPGLATPSWDAGGANCRAAAGCSSAGASGAGADTADAVPATAGPVAPRVQIGSKLQAMLDKLDDPAPPGSEECPVCNEFMVNECMLSTCGHRWCQDCHKRMKKVSTAGRVKCPLCNNGLHARDVTLVALQEPPEEASAQDEAALMQSFGTKMGAVVKCVQDTLADKPTDKMLVFSAWSEVLELLAHSLNNHGVRYLFGKDKPSLQRALDAFDASRAEAKQAVEVCGGATVHRPRRPAGRKKRPHADDAGGEPRVLLLQLKQAAAGLNLVQAQHVLLIEPSTDPAVEAQAVARIHRMNQTSETRVVRFVVDSTVEAALHTLTSAKASQMDMACATAQGHRSAASEPKLTVTDVAYMLFDGQVRKAGE